MIGIRRSVYALMAALVVVAFCYMTSYAQVTPAGGISRATLPLERVGNSVALTTNGTIKATHLYGTTGTFGSITIGSCVGCGGGGGGGSGSIGAFSASNGAIVTATPRASWSGGTVPTSTDGTLIVHKSVNATAGHRYLVLGQAQLNMDAAATNTALWIATNAQAAQAVAIFTVSQSYSETQTVMWVDTSMGGTIDFELYGTPDAANGGDFRTNVYQAAGDKTAWAAKSITAIRVIDLDSVGSGGGGGSVPDPLTINNWQPSGGTANVLTPIAVTGSATDTGHTTNGNGHVTGNLTVDGAISGIIPAHSYPSVWCAPGNSISFTCAEITVKDATLTPIACSYTANAGGGTGSGTCHAQLFDNSTSTTVCDAAFACNTTGATPATCTGTVLANHTLVWRVTAPDIFSKAPSGNLTCSMKE